MTNTSPYLVTAHNGRSNFFVGGFIPRTMAIAAGNAELKSAFRIAGGMNNGPEIFPFFRTALRGMNGSVLMSGGTRCFDDEGKIQASVAEVVADMGLMLPNLITMGSFPRTARFGFVGDGRFTVGDGSDVTVNFGTDYIVAIQSGPEDVQALGWDGDVDAYIAFMKNLRTEMGFQTGVIVWNGGGVTITETKKAYEDGNTIFVITDTGRAADHQLSEANFSGNGIYHISKDNPEKLHSKLRELHFSN